MSSGGRFGQALGAATLFGCLWAAACADSAKPPTSIDSVAGASGEPSIESAGAAGDAVGGAGPSEAPERFGEFAAYEPSSLVEAESPGHEGGPAALLLPPYGTSTTCGDAIVGPDEECDDGD